MLLDRNVLYACGNLATTKVEQWKAAVVQIRIGGGRIAALVFKISVRVTIYLCFPCKNVFNSVALAQCFVHINANTASWK